MEDLNLSVKDFNSLSLDSRRDFICASRKVLDLMHFLYGDKCMNCKELVSLLRISVMIQQSFKETVESQKLFVFDYDYEKLS